MTINYQIKLLLFDDYFIIYLTPIIPIIQRKKQNANTQSIFYKLFDTLHESFFELFDDCSMIFRW